MQLLCMLLVLSTSESACSAHTWKRMLARLYMQELVRSVGVITVWWTTTGLGYRFSRCGRKAHAEAFEITSLVAAVIRAVFCKSGCSTAVHCSACKNTCMIWLFTAVSSLSFLLMHMLDGINTETWTVVCVLCKVSWNAKLVVDVSLIKHGIRFSRCWTFDPVTLICQLTC